MENWAKMKTQSTESPIPPPRPPVGNSHHYLHLLSFLSPLSWRWRSPQKICPSQTPADTVSTTQHESSQTPLAWFQTVLWTENKQTRVLLTTDRRITKFNNSDITSFKGHAMQQFHTGQEHLAPWTSSFGSWKFNG